MPYPGLGVGVIVQCPADSFMARVDTPVPALNRPTAMQVPAALHETPVSTLAPAALGLGTTVQAWPSQCSIRVVAAPPVPPEAPTA